VSTTSAAADPIAASAPPLRLVRGRGLRDWIFTEPAAKLAWRASLPGAYGYDQAAHELRILGATGAAPEHVLALALPASWMVNSKATSITFRAWLTPEGRDAWIGLLDAVGESMSPEGWLSAEGDRDYAARAVAVLSEAGAGASLAAVSKVLALFRPQLVPLMDDAALAFWLGPREELPADLDADRPRGAASLFVPAMDAFARAMRSLEPALVRLAADHHDAVLDAAQALDRLVWVDSWGYRHDPTLRWVRDEHAEYIVRLPSKRTTLAPTEIGELSAAEAGIARAAAALP
jgi:hypothetical protein